MKIRSPSQTMLFDRCRWKWYLARKLGVTEVYIGKRDLAAAVGTSVGRALSVYYKQKMGGDNVPMNSLKEFALQQFEHEVQAQVDKGRDVANIPESVKYPALIPKMLDAYFKEPCVPPDWQVLGTESKCGPDNTAFIDIWGRNDRGVWVIDFKCKMSCKPGSIVYELQDYERSWQLGHYVWSLHRLLGEWPVTSGINLIVGEPKPTSKYMEFEVDLDWMRWWESTAIGIWAEMDRVEDTLAEHPDWSLDQIRDFLGMSTSHKDGIFKCDLYDLCMDHGGDHTSTDAYIQVEKS